MTRLLLPRRLLHIVRRPIRVDIEDSTGSPSRSISFDDTLRLGYGEHCELRLDGESKPEVVCNLQRDRGPLRIWTPMESGEPDDSVEVRVDGHPLSASAQDLHPGSRVEVYDRRTGHRYGLIVEPGGLWLLRPRNLAFVVVMLGLAGALYGMYFYYGLEGAQDQLRVAEERLRLAESDVERARRSLAEVERRLTATEGEFALAIRDIKQAQALSERAIRTEFELRLTALTERARVELERISERDVDARERLRAETRAEVAALRQELEDRMVAAYQEFKRVEERLIESLGARLESMEPVGARFKRVLQAARGAALYVRTSYDIEFARTGEVVTHDSFGSGFLVSDRGLALSARHVLYPWHYDRQLQVLVALELAQVHEDSVGWSIWATDSRVLAGEGAAGEPIFNLRDAWRSSSGERAVRHLYSPSIRFTEEWIEAPIGTVRIPVPVAGPDDIAVVQLVQLDSPVDYLALARRPAEPLDDVLTMGYPFSRLEDGRAVPQGVTGFVRRITEEMLELNAALSPGSSGGAILDRDGEVIGMAVGVLQSDVYGLAIRSRDLEQALEEARERVRAEEARLEALGCNPGEVDGVFDARTSSAYACERARQN